MATTPFLKKLADLDDAARKSDEAIAPNAEALEKLAQEESAANRTEHAALAFLVAARWRGVEGQSGLRERDLEAASALPSLHSDVRALVLRSLAASLVEIRSFPSDKGLLERAETILCDALRLTDLETLTSGELADAHVLLAKALLGRGDQDGAKRALELAKRLQPRDTRGIDDVAAQLQR
jgi:hypothetical protein